MPRPAPKTLGFGFPHWVRVFLPSLVERDDDDEEESSKDDDDDEEEEEEETSEEDKDKDEEHLALAESAALPAIDPTGLRRAQKTIKPHTPPSPSAEVRLARFMVAPALPSSPPSPLSPWSSLLPQIPSLPLPLPSPPTSPTYDHAPLGYREAMIRSRAASPSTHHLLLPSEIPSLPLLLPSTAHRDDIPKADMPLWKRARFTSPTGRFIDTLDASIRASESRAMTAVEEVNKRVIDLATTQRQDAHELQALAHSKSRSQVMEAKIRALQRDVGVL
ncbi:hypothetical protein Tco_1185083 [Tanacetum coccineum]